MLRRYPILVMFFKSCILAIVLALSLSMPANSFEFFLKDGKLTIVGDPTVLLLNGPITKKMWLYFIDSLVINKRIKTVELNSPGGYVIYAETIATRIRKYGLNTRVGKNEMCLSACVLLFQAGVKRTAHKTANFMVHPVKIKHNGVVAADLWSTNRFYGWLMKFGMKPEVVPQLRTGKNVYFDAEHALRYGLATEIESETVKK